MRLGGAAAVSVLGSCCMVEVDPSLQKAAGPLEESDCLQTALTLDREELGAHVASGAPSPPSAAMCRATAAQVCFEGAAAEAPHTR
eukprot:CAMPEP_0113272290 /NCGR_PEP_ID=MMETSP0008_2-20120614/23245_1 /TAXON_ID=97485 /ORGANISM="Prymnesium parvum" /LENGTH=85 /DNA_ID=CAMNT_0000121743 /DNA_START=343 /DNA_END=601 /DNA_ORIENTATION=- /assembly_acc=CAM_ASM_000153